MSKALRSIQNPIEKENTIQRRIHEEKGGLGYLAACKAKGITPKIKKP
jgi:hypothetical protein